MVHGRPGHTFWPKECHVGVTATPLDLPHLLATQTAFSRRFGFHTQTPEWWVSWLNGSPRDGMGATYATVYAGHQFGTYVPQLGDGRALGMGFCKDLDGISWECQLKGSGLTPFSRMGDGRAVLRSSIREYLCSENMAGLGIPSTRAMALIGSATQVRRETWETAAVLLRLAPTFVRFGTLQYLAYTGKTAALDQLLANLIQMQGNEISIKDWFLSVCETSGQLCAAWQSVGFCHGVLNTDNMSVHGWTLDYGPFGFVETYDPGYVCNHSDDQGRYAYWAQPEIIEWNLFQLGRALARYFPDTVIQTGLHLYNAVFSTAYLQKMAEKLALPSTQVTWSFIQNMITMMTQSGVDYTLFLRQLSLDPFDREWVKHAAINPAPVLAWLEPYQSQRSQDPHTLARMREVNPAYVLRNWVAQWVIDEAEAGRTEAINAVCDILRRPYEDHPEWAHLRQSAPAHYRGLHVSCSS